MSKNSEGVIRWRQRVKQKLVAAFGGACAICGYDRCSQALDFHHLDPGEKDFAITGRGIPRAWKKVLDEAEKCVMLCKNCHTEVHAGLLEVPLDARRMIRPAPDAIPMRRLLVRPKRGRQPPPPAKPKVPNRPKGKALRTMVQTSSRVAVAKRYGVSETAVRKWLRTDSLNGVY